MVGCRKVLSSITHTTRWRNQYQTVAQPISGVAPRAKGQVFSPLELVGNLESRNMSAPGFSMDDFDDKLADQYQV